MSRLASIWLAMALRSRPAWTDRSRPAVTVAPSWVMSLLLWLAVRVHAVADLHRGQVDVSPGVQAHVPAALQRTADIVDVSPRGQRQVVGGLDAGGVVGVVLVLRAKTGIAVGGGDGALVEDVAADRRHADVTAGEDAARLVDDVVARPAGPDGFPLGAGRC